MSVSVPFVGTSNDQTFDSILVKRTATINTLVTTTFNNPLLTAKGSLLSSNGTNNVALTVGANGTHLEADSTTSSGLAWVATEGFSVTKSGTQAIGTATPTVVTGWVVGTGGRSSANFNITTGVYTCAKDGFYLFTGTLSYATNATGYRRAALQLNAGVDNSVSGPANSAVSTDVEVVSLIQLVVGDTVSLLADQSSGGNLNVAATSRFSCAKVI